MKALVIATTNLRRLFRLRSNIFFVIIFPMMLILLLGTTFGGGFTPVIGVVGVGAGPLGEELVAWLAETENLDVRDYPNEEALVSAVERGRVQAGVVIPAGYDDTLRGGGEAVLRFFGRPGTMAPQLRAAVGAAAGEQSLLARAARFAEAEGVASADNSFAQAAEAAASVSGVRVRTTIAGKRLFTEDIGRFDMGASTQLPVFIFLGSLTGSVALIETRKLGLSRRMFSTPTPLRTILAGEALGRFAIALLQGLIIMLGSSLLFGVNWGNLAGASLVLVAFSLVGAGAGMLLGSALDNDQQAGSIALLLGLGLAAMGGSMVPIEIFPDTMRTVAHFTPHAWGNDAFAELVRRDGGVADILRELAVLAVFAAVLFTLAIWRLRKAITS